MSEGRIERLVAKAARGDGRAFAKLYDEFADRVYGFVRLRVADRRDAEELTMTVFLNAWRALPAYEPRGLPFSAWLFRIARNAVTDSHRRAARQPVTVPEDSAEGIVSAMMPDEEVLRRLDAEKLRAAMSRLTDEQEAVLTMRFVWGAALKETALMMERSEGAVKALQHRALRSLAAILSGEDADETA